MLTKPKHLHFIGIKGVGMSALAIYAKKLGIKVTGSDVEEEFVTDKILDQAGIKYNQGFRPRNIKGRPDNVVISAAYGEENPEVRAAINRDLPTVTYSELLGFFMNLARQNYKSQGIAISGIHGKTTTTALLAYALKNLKQDPSYIIGSGGAGNLGLNGHAGKGGFFICEADEYKRGRNDSLPKFFDLSPEIVIITSIEMDHPDLFETVEDIYNVFYRFACRIPRNGFIVCNYDYPKIQKLTKSLVDRRFETYGWHPDSKWRIKIKSQKENTFYLIRGSQKYGPFKSEMPGKHNMLNTSATVVTCLNLDFQEDKIIKATQGFKGPERRFQFIGEREKIKFYDDYAHHPTAIRATLETLKQNFPKDKRWIIFQPHTYSRTQKLLDDFAKSFTDADKIIVADIFGSARERKGNISGRDLSAEISRFHSDVLYVPTIDEIVRYLKKELVNGTVVMTIGAGDIYKVGREMLTDTNQKSKCKIKVSKFPKKF